MLATKHRIIADFYFEIDNQNGGVRHLERAADRYPQSRAGQQARERLKALGGSSKPGQTKEK